MKFKGYILGCLSAISYGTIPLFALPLMREGLQFDSVLFYRFFFTSILIGLYLIAKKTDLKVSRRELGILGILGLTFALSSHFLFTSYQYMPASIASTILFMYPVFVAILMGVLFKEKITWTVALAILLSFVGIVFLNKSDQDVSVTSMTGIILGVLSALMYAIYMIIVNKSTVKKMAGTKLTFYSMGFCSLFFLFRSFMQGGLQPIQSVETGLLMVLFGLVSTVISCIAMVYAIHYIGSTPTAIMGALEPVVAVAISVLLFGEAFTVDLAVGILFIITAVMIIILSDYITRGIRSFHHPFR